MRIFIFFIFIFTLLSLSLGCKTLKKDSSSELSGITEDSKGVIKLRYIDDNTDEEKTLFLGILQPGGRIFYLEQGMNDLYKIIRNKLNARTVDLGFLEQVAQTLENVNETKLDPGELVNPYYEIPRSSSAKIGRNVLSYYFRSPADPEDTHIASGIIPPALWSKLIDHGYFMLPNK
jgi:hypothetical protein